jgi:hypothetical protein
VPVGIPGPPGLASRAGLGNEELSGLCDGAELGNDEYAVVGDGAELGNESASVGPYAGANCGVLGASENVGCPEADGLILAVGKRDTEEPVGD